MASSTTAVSTAVNTDRSRARSRKKKKQFQHLTQSSSSSFSDSSSNWKSQAQQRSYSTRLLKALRHVSQNGRGVRDAADRALAATARGRTRWSRAILTARGVRLKRRRKFVAKRHAPASSSAAGRSRRPRVSVLRLKAKNLPAVQRKAKVLGRLVPGCRKESLPVILEEAEDYIPALEMQIRAMTELLNRLAGSARPSSSSSS